MAIGRISRGGVTKTAPTRVLLSFGPLIAACSSSQVAASSFGSFGGVRESGRFAAVANECLKFPEFRAKTPPPNPKRPIDFLASYLEPVFNPQRAPPQIDQPTQTGILFSLETLNLMCSFAPFKSAPPFSYNFNCLAPLILWPSFRCAGRGPTWQNTLVKRVAVQLEEKKVAEISKDNNRLV